MKSSKVISTAINDAKNMIIKVLRLGTSDVQTSRQISPFGVDSNPIKDMVAIHSETGIKGETVIIGYVNKEHVADIGELRLFSTNESGEIKSTVFLRNDETLELMGDSNFLVKFNELQTEFNKLQSAYNSHVHAASGAPTSIISTANISLAKNDKIKSN